MNNLQQLIFSTLVAVLGYLLTVGVIKPLLDFHKKKADIGIQLNYYSHIITSPGTGKLADEAAPVIRRLAMEIESEYLALQFKGIFTKLRAIPDREHILGAKRALVFLSNSLHNGETEENHIKLGEVFTKLSIDEVDVDNGVKVAMEIFGKSGQD